MPSIAKKMTVAKKYKKHLLSSFPKTKSTQITESVLAERSELVKNTKFDSELIKLEHCFFKRFRIKTLN